MIDLDAIRARDRDYDDVFEAQANMSKDIAHRLVAWPVADRRALLAYVDELRSRLAEAEALLREARAHLDNLGNKPDLKRRIDAHLAADSASGGA